MVKVKRVLTGVLQSPNCVTAELFADAKSDVGSSMTVVGLPTGCTLDAGSYVYTGDFHVGILLSDDSWAFDDDEE